MTHAYASKSESTAAETFSALPAPAYPCQSFAPLLPASYTDAAAATLTAKPDFLCQQSRSYTFIESKAGKLNSHRTHESSRAALESEYAYRFRRPSTDTSHSVLSKALWERGYRTSVLNHAFNHSLWKVAALQAQHGWQRYIVCFKNKPTKDDALRYLAAGLVFCTEKTAPQLLVTIELAQHGFFLPFVFNGKGYSFSVTANHLDCGKSSEEIADSDRIKFIAALSSANATDAAATF